MNLRQRSASRDRSRSVRWAGVLALGLGLACLSGAETPVSYPPSLALNNITQVSVQLSWDNIPGATRYELSFGTDANAANRTPQFIARTTHTLTNLQPNTVYRVKVRAVVGGRAGAWSPIKEFSTQIPVMNDLTADDVRDTAVHLTWSSRYSDLPEVQYDVSFGTDPDASSDGVRSTDKPFLTLRDLVPETKYYLKLRTRNPRLNGPWSDPISINTLPLNSGLTPQQLTLQSGPQNTLVVTWQNAAGANSYDLAYGTDEAAENIGVVPVDKTTLSLQVSPNTSYYLKVRSVTRGSTGPWSSIQSFLTLPGKARGLKVTALTSDSAMVEWQSLSGKGIARYYNLGWGTDPNATNLGTTTTANASWALERLRPDQRYYVRVRTANETGTSPWSDPFGFTTLPSGLEGVEVYDVKHTTAMVKWASLGSAASYEVSWGLNQEDRVRSSLETPQSPAQITGLIPDQSFGVKVRGLKADRQPGAWSNSVSFTTFAIPPAPSRPALMKLTASYAEVSWTAQPGVSVYATLVTQEELAEEGRQEEFNAASARLKDLQENTQYFLKVRGQNQGGPGAWSPALTFTTPPTSDPKELKAETVQATEAMLSWRRLPGTATLTYQVRYAPNQEEWKVLSEFAPLRLNLLPLVPDAKYRLQIRGQNAGGSGPWSEELTFHTPPLPPSLAPDGLRATELNDVSALIAWNAIPKQRVDHYDFSLGTDQDAGNLGLQTQTALSRKLTGLSPETSYFVKLRGVNVSGEGPWSEVLLVTTRATPPMAPPPLIKLGRVSNDQVELTWQAAADAKGYDVSVGTDAAGENGGAPKRILDTEYVFGGLKPKTLYAVKVRSVNSGGPGPWSRVFTATTPATPAP